MSGNSFLSLNINMTVVSLTDVVVKVYTFGKLASGRQFDDIDKAMLYVHEQIELCIKTLQEQEAAGE